MINKTFHFSHPRLLADLYCGDDANLARMEHAFGARLVVRDNWIQVSAEQQEVVDSVETFLRILESGRNQGLRITQPDFEHFLETSRAGRTDEIRALFAESFVLNLRRCSVVPKTVNQKRYLQAIRGYDVVFGIGPAGTGKTFLAVAEALDALQNNRVEKIILTRPAVEAGEALGFLPGDLTEKIQPYLLPLYDAIYTMLGRAEGRRLLGLDSEKRDDRTNNFKVEIAPLAYMRGRTLSNAFIILDEAQNTTRQQMMMFLTRLGENSRMVITGDRTQIDLPHHKRSGLKEAEKILKRVSGIQFHYFDDRDVVRHRLVRDIINAYAEYDRTEDDRADRKTGKD